MSIVRHSIAVVIAIATCGCASAPLSAARPTPAPPSLIAGPVRPPAHPASRPVVRVRPQSRKPYLLHLPGIGGVRTCDVALLHGLDAGGYDGEVHVHEWTGTDEGLAALWGRDRHRAQAQIVANLLTAAFDVDPHRPLYLTAHSGGTGIAVWALELLPERVKVRSLLLLEPALSPTYDLSMALRHVGDRAYVFSSVQDPVVGLGCRVMGTIDGPKVYAAGNVGFSEPAGADSAAYGKLVGLPYESAWVKLGNFGDHVGPLARAFSRVVVAPLLLHDVLPTSADTRPATTSRTTP